MQRHRIGAVEADVADGQVPYGQSRGSLSSLDKFPRKASLLESLCSRRDRQQ